MKEKRQYNRLRYKIDVDYDISRRQVFIRAETRDISGGGVCLITKEAIPVGMDLELKFLVPDNSNPIEVEGKAVWHNAFKIKKNTFYENGIQFTGLSEPDRILIEKFIENTTFDA